MIKKDPVIAVSSEQKIAIQNRQILEEEDKMMVLRLPNTKNDSDTEDDYDDEEVDQNNDKIA